MSLEPSDVALFACLVFAVGLTLYFALGKPRSWYRDPLGWVILGYALAVDALLVLIVYGIVFGQKVDEPYRLAVSLALATALVVKTWTIYRERRRGRLSDEQTQPRYEGARTMSNLDPREYKNGERISLVAGETVTSDSPSVNLGPAKAIVAAIGAALVGGLTALGAALTDNVVTPGEWVTVALGVLVGSGLVGGATYYTKTTVTGK